MAIQSVKSFMISTPEEAEVREKLEALYKLRDDIVIEISERKKELSKYKNLSSKIKDLADKNNYLLSSVNKIEKDISDKQLSLNNISAELEKSENKNNKLRKSIDENIIIEKDIINNIKSLKDSLRVEKNNFDKWYKNTTISTKTLSGENKKLSDDNEKIVERNKELSNELNILLAKISQKSLLLGEYDGRIKKLEKVEGELIKEIEIKESEYNNRISKFENDFIIMKINADEQIKKMYSEKEKEISKRDGDISNRENWVNKREQKLKEIKNDLEVFYNKKLDNIIF